MPTEVFKSVSLALHPEAQAALFKTSGTSNETERGCVGYDAGGLALMDATIDTAGKAFLFPDGVEPVFLIMAPPPAAVPEMVMAYGMNRLIHSFGRPESRFLIGREGFDPAGLVKALETLSTAGTPVALCGGSFGFVNFFDYCDDHGISLHLPEGSRCLDAGGFKGRSREVSREAFVERCAEKLDMPEAFSVNLLGMTEIASQFYDNTLRNRIRGAGETPRMKVNPPWTRTQVVDADTLEPLPEGEEGLLRHLDLANRGHVLAIQTDDVGVMRNGGFEILGRAGEGEARGCSLTIDELTTALEEKEG